MKITAAVFFTISFLLILVATYQWTVQRERRREEEQRKLREYVKDLPGWQPTLLIMHVQDRYNYLEIAAKLEMPAQFVLNELVKAYGELRMRQIANEPPRKARWRGRSIGLIYRLLGG